MTPDTATASRYEAPPIQAPQLKDEAKGADPSAPDPDHITTKLRSGTRPSVGFEAALRGHAHEVELGGMARCDLAGPVVVVTLGFTFGVAF
jgi:hypothetical protein